MNEIVLRGRVFLYGIAGAYDKYRVIRYSCIDQEFLSIHNIMNDALWMKTKYPNIEHVYAVDGRAGLKNDYLDSIRDNTIESCLIFKDILEREGIRVI